VGMRERVELLGGRMRVDSRPGQGTRIKVHAPLEREPAL
jgi:signal transduction histidine kinase